MLERTTNQIQVLIVDFESLIGDSYGGELDMDKNQHENNIEVFRTRNKQTQGRCRRIHEFGALNCSQIKGNCNQYNFNKNTEHTNSDVNTMKRYK